MERREFLKRVKAYARKTGQTFAFDKSHGKGSHGRVYLGQRFTTVKDGYIPVGLKNHMLADLKIPKEDF